MKRTWKHKVRPLIDLGHCLGVPLNDGTLAMVDYEDRGIVEGWNWSIDGRKTRVARGGTRLAAAIMGRGLIDHANGNVRDNRRKNLRPATSQQNARNRGMSARNKSGFKGVSYRKDRRTWLAAIRVEGRLLKIGTFETPEKAARAYDNAARQYFGEYARPNFPDKFTVAA